MIRRFVRIARAASLAMGAALLLWTPFSYVFAASGEFPFPRLSYVNVMCVSDVLQLTAVEGQLPVEAPHRFSGSIVRVSWLREAFGPSQSTDMTLSPKSFQFSRFVAASRSFAITTIALPMWLLALLALLWPAATFLASHRRRARLNRGLCPTCSYDLTANTSGICPECGTAIARA